MFFFSIRSNKSAVLGRTYQKHDITISLAGWKVKSKSVSRSQKPQLNHACQLESSPSLWQGGSGFLAQRKDGSALGPLQAVQQTHLLPRAPFNQHPYSVPLWKYPLPLSHTLYPYETQHPISTTARVASYWKLSRAAQHQACADRQTGIFRMAVVNSSEESWWDAMMAVTVVHYYYGHNFSIKQNQL